MGRCVSVQERRHISHGTVFSHSSLQSKGCRKADVPRVHTVSTHSLIVSPPQTKLAASLCGRLTAHACVVVLSLSLLRAPPLFVCIALLPGGTLFFKTHLPECLRQFSKL